MHVHDRVVNSTVQSEPLEQLQLKGGAGWGGVSVQICPSLAAALRLNCRSVLKGPRCLQEDKDCQRPDANAHDERPRWVRVRVAACPTRACGPVTPAAWSSVGAEKLATFGSKPNTKRGRRASRRVRSVLLALWVTRCTGRHPPCRGQEPRRGSARRGRRGGQTPPSYSSIWISWPISSPPS